MAGLAGLLNLLLQKTEGLADFQEIHDFICRTLKTKRGDFARTATVMGNFTLCCQATDSSSCLSTGNLVFANVNLKPTALKNFMFDWELCLRLYEVYRFQNLVGLASPIKHTLHIRTLNIDNSSKEKGTYLHHRFPMTKNQSKPGKN